MIAILPDQAQVVPHLCLPLFPRPGNFGTTRPDVTCYRPQPDRLPELIGPWLDGQSDKNVLFLMLDFQCVCERRVDVALLPPFTLAASCCGKDCELRKLVVARAVESLKSLRYHGTCMFRLERIYMHTEYYPCCSVGRVEGEIIMLRESQPEELMWP